MRLDIALVYCLGAILSLDYDFGFFESPLHIAQHRLVVTGDVALELLMEPGRPWLHSRFDVRDRREDLILDLDEAQGFLSGVGAYRRHGRNRMALVEHFFAGQNIAADMTEVDGRARSQHDRRVLRRRQICGRYHGANVRESLGFAGID